VFRDRRESAIQDAAGPVRAAALRMLADTYGVYGPLLPIWLQRPLLRPFAMLARRRGYRAAVVPDPAAVPHLDRIVVSCGGSSVEG
jgi:hypothetical protein